MVGYFQWLKNDFGFTEQAGASPTISIRSRFLPTSASAMQGYVTSEPFAVETQGKFKPKIFLLADQGFSTYSTLIETRRDLVEKKPDLVQRFVDASISAGTTTLWRQHGGKRADQEAKSGDERRADRLFGRQDEGIRHRRFRRCAEGRHRRDDAMRAMKGFFDKMVRAGVVKPALDYKRAYTLQFVNKGVGRQSCGRRSNAPMMAEAVAPSPAIVSLHGVGKAFPNGVVALRDASSICAEGEFVSLLGPSGCGKSTALRIIAGLTRAFVRRRCTGATSGDAPRRDRFRVPGADADAVGECRRQRPAAVETRRRRSRRFRAAGARGAGARGLAAFANAYPREFSGGMKMRVSIARALVTTPKLLLMDEPFAALDEITRFQAQQRSAGAVGGARQTVVFVTHSVFELVYLSSRIVVMTGRPGRVFADIPIDAPYPRNAGYPHLGGIRRAMPRSVRSAGRSDGGGARRERRIGPARGRRTPRAALPLSSCLPRARVRGL